MVAITVLALAAVAGATAGAATQADDDRLDAIRGQLRSVLTGVGWSSAEWGVLAVSLDTGDTLFARNPSAPLVPASNLKLVTTAAAIEHLGPDYRYQTLVLADGPISDGVLRGNLILYGTGDPGISDRFYDRRTAVFEELADQLRDAGITAVMGDVVGDGSFFSGPLLGEGWDPRDLNDWFAAPAAALSFNENMVTLRIEAGATGGARPTIRTLPENAEVPVMNTATTGRGRIRVGRDRPTDPISIEGGIPPGGREVWRQMTVSDPARYAAQIFANVLGEQGIPVRGAVRAVYEPRRSQVTGRRLWAPGLRGDAPRTVARHRSPPLRDYLEVVNKKSHNLLADLTLKTVGRIVTGDGSFQGGARVVEAFLARELGVDTAQVEIHDGSGLSGSNRIAADDFVRLMDHMTRSAVWDAWWATLPEAGNPRELRRMYRTPAAGNLRAKTGTIEDVSALSGMVRSARGERIAFSIIGNGLPSTWGAKRVEDRFSTRLAAFDRPFDVRSDVRFARRAGDEPTPTRVADARESGDAAVDSARRVAARDVEAAAARSDTAEDDPADAAEPDAEPRTHRVESGENLTVIARRHGVSVNALVEANDGISPRKLQPGAELVIPPSEPGEPAPAERTDPEQYEVQPGENFTVIARRYGVSLNDLLDANPGVSPRSLKAGQVIEIPPAGDTNQDDRP